MTAVLLLVSAILAAVAAAGVAHPFRRSGSVVLERLTDPLEDERAGLLRALRELEDERATGALSEPDYRSLRMETERRAVAVLRAIEARDGAGSTAAELQELRPRTSNNGDGLPPRRSRLLATALAAVILVAVAVPLLAGAVRTRSGDQPATGDSQSQASPMQFFLDRVRQHPNDLAARLDLAAAYLDLGDLKQSVEQYLAALRIEPTNPEALSTLGFLLYKGGKPGEGLKAVDKALASAPDFPEALFYKGVILLDGLNEPAEAADALRAYLAAAPFDTPSRRQEAQKLLSRAERQEAG